MLTKFFNFHFSPDNNLMKDDARGKIKQEHFFSQMQMISQSKGNVNFSCKYRTFFVNLCNLKKLLTSINKQKKLFFWRQRYDLQRVERTKTQCYKPNRKCDDDSWAHFSAISRYVISSNFFKKLLATKIIPHFETNAKLCKMLLFN